MLLATLQRMVIASRSQLKENLQTIEANHIQRWGVLPSDASYVKAYRKYRHACTLLRKWCITMHDCTYVHT